MPGEFIATLTRKLSSLTDLDAGDLRVIDALAIRGKLFQAKERIASEDDAHGCCCLILNGLAYSSKTTPSGRRQILSLHVPGDMPDLASLPLASIDHDLTTLTECTAGVIPHAILRDLIGRTNIAMALWRETLIQAAINREWMVNVGQREAIARMAHLLLEMRHRLHEAGRSSGNTFELRITQSELADCLGISTVHVNRVLQQLRRMGLISIDRNRYRLLDLASLSDIGEFNANYLGRRTMPAARPDQSALGGSSLSV